MPIRPACIAAIFCGALAAAPGAARAEQPAARRQHAPPPSIAISRDTRLLVIAPHPDDETLGAGGLMQRVRTAHGVVRIVYLTDGDGYPEGVRAEDHVVAPTPDDYRGYGRRRRHEARDAMGALELRDYTLTFLSFPDSGLSRLITTYWSEHAVAYRSPFTRLDRPPRSEMIVPDTEYRGEDLTQELASVIAEFKPTLLLVPRKEDQHPDHCASWFFIADALSDVRRVRPETSVDLVNYVVHFNGWPFQDDSRTLPPPPGLLGGVSGWIRFELTQMEALAKREALQKYASQMLVMKWFLDGFARGNEVFSRPAPPRVTLPLHRSPCG
jgi:LmbE family N-acetylglucosaminyl deacetylase